MKFWFQKNCKHKRLNFAPAIKACNIYAGYSSGNKYALNNISITVHQGTRVALIGSNGAGKSTLLKIIAGLLPIKKGIIKVFGYSVGGCLHQVAYLPQSASIDWSFPISLYQFLLTGRYVHLNWLNNFSKKDYYIVDEIIEILKLKDLKKNQIQHLSGGQKQRALLGRALIHKAELFLLDEPLNAIDNENKYIISMILDILKKKGKTVFMATHDLSKIKTDFDDACYLHESKQMNIFD